MFKWDERENVNVPYSQVGPCICSMFAPFFIMIVLLYLAVPIGIFIVPPALKYFFIPSGIQLVQETVLVGLCPSPQNAGKKHSVKETEAQYVKFEFPNPSDALEIKEIHFDALDAGHADGRKILVLAPHEDDEMLVVGCV